MISPSSTLYCTMHEKYTVKEDNNHKRKPNRPPILQDQSEHVTSAVWMPNFAM